MSEQEELSAVYAHADRMDDRFMKAIAERDALAAELAETRIVADNNHLAAVQNKSIAEDNLARLRALEADVADVAKINVDLMKRNRALEAALREVLDDLGEVVGQRHHKDKYRVYQVSPQTIAAARKVLFAFPAQTETTGVKSE